ncbi:MAG: serine hydrolase domain-containing protein [Bacteroidota bacterium]
MRHHVLRSSLALNLSLLCLFVGLASCDPNIPQLCDPTPQFDIEEFVNLMEQQLIDDGVTGYQLAVSQNGNLYDTLSGGFARHEDNGGEILMNPETRLNVASVSKLMAAIALLKALEMKGLDPDDDMVSHLPESWKNAAHSKFRRQGSANLISFRELTQMRTGFRFSQDGIASTSTPSNDQLLQVLTYEPTAKNAIYHNGNFCFIRVLIGEMIYNLDATATDYNETCTEKFLEFIDQNLYEYAHNDQLRPPNTLDAYDNFYNWAHPWAYPYPFDPNNLNAWEADITRTKSIDNAGTSGMLLSAMDLASILAYTVHGKNGEILSASSQEALLEDGNDMGFFNSIEGEHGFYHVKGGTKGPQSSTGSALRSFVAVFPNGVEAVFITNCNYNQRDEVVVENFDKAWVNPCK